MIRANQQITSCGVAPTAGVSWTSSVVARDPPGRVPRGRHQVEGREPVTVCGEPLTSRLVVTEPLPV